MKVTKKHLAYGAVVAVGAVVLLVDQVSGPAAGEEASASAAAAEVAVNREAAPGAKGEAKAYSENGDEAVIAARLADVAARRGVDAVKCADAFALPAAFRPVETAAAAPVAPEKPAAPSPVDVFGRKHKLVTVLVGRGGAGDAAQVDGRLLKVGDEIDGFRLTAVTQKAATFAGFGGEVELRFDEAGGPVMTASTSDK